MNESICAQKQRAYRRKENVGESTVRIRTKDGSLTQLGVGKKILLLEKGTVGKDISGMFAAGGGASGEN